LLGKLGTVEGQKVSDAIHHLIGLTEPNKDPTQGSFAPCVFYCRPRVIERGSVDIYGLSDEPSKSFGIGKNWWTWPGSNRRPPCLQSKRKFNLSRCFGCAY